MRQPGAALVRHVGGWTEWVNPAVFASQYMIEAAGVAFEDLPGVIGRTLAEVTDHIEPDGRYGFLFFEVTD
jgi:hypothetical protein